MRIESIDIKGFGCLVGKRYEFPADKACLIVADNETGKSTLAAAILATLCGFPKRKQAGEQMKLSDVYAPWNSDVYAVEMDILAGGRRLRIERDFARGSFVVRDRETGKDISADFDSDLASHFLHLPREDFQRVAFISGKEVPSFRNGQTIQSRLSALAEGSTEDTAAEPAIASLEGARYTLDTSLTIQTAIKRLSASIDEKRQALRELDASIDRAGEKCGQLEESKALRAQYTADLKQLETEHQAARLAEDKARADQVDKVRVAYELRDLETRLAAIEQGRRSAKQSGSRIAFAGIAAAIVSFGAFLMDFVSLTASAAATLIGIAIAAAGAVRATKAEIAGADEKARLERDIEEARRNLPTGESAEGVRSSADIEQEQRELRGELDSLNSAIIDLEKQVGFTVEAYRRDYPKLNDDLQQLERELRKAQRFEAAVGIAHEVLGEVAGESHRRWAAALNEQVSMILPHLNPNYGDVLFDDNLSFTIRHVSENRVLENAEIDTQLSTGAKDQVYLAVRLAFCRELTKDGESIPILLDDPLLAADDARFARGMRYLAEACAAGNQVLILSCSGQRHRALAREAWFEERVCDLEPNMK